MKYCIYCGAEMPPDSHICPNCGYHTRSSSRTVDETYITIDEDDATIVETTSARRSAPRQKHQKTNANGRTGSQQKSQQTRRSRLDDDYHKPQRTTPGWVIALVTFLITGGVALGAWWLINRGSDPDDVVMAPPAPPQHQTDNLKLKEVLEIYDSGTDLINLATDLREVVGIHDDVMQKAKSVDLGELNTDEQAILDDCYERYQVHYATKFAGYYDARYPNYDSDLWSRVASERRRIDAEGLLFTARDKYGLTPGLDLRLSWRVDDLSEDSQRLTGLIGSKEVYIAEGPGFVIKGNADLDGDGFVDALVWVADSTLSTSAGACAFVYFDKGQFVITDTFGRGDDAAITDYNNSSAVLYREEGTYPQVTRVWTLRNGQPTLLARQDRQPLDAIYEIKAADGVRTYSYDLNSDGRSDRIDVKQGPEGFMRALITISDPYYTHQPIEVLFERRLGALSTVSNGMKDLVVDEDTRLQWSGTEYE